ncbi:MAG: tetratricopeptide repeat protein [Burkholderiales bacterium]|nr:tetratricopeptide repeat protein [Burkholderiales bacterium]
MSGRNGGVERARKLRMQGRPGEAEVLLRRRLAAKPGDAAAGRLLGLIRAEAGAYAEAEYWVNMALAADPGNPEAHLLLGQLRLESGSPMDAAACFEHALSLAPGDAQALFGLGNAYRRLGRCEDALRSYDESLMLRPDQPEILCNRGNALQELGRHAEALDSFDRALRLRPEVSMLHYNRGNALMALGRFQEAVDSFDRVLRHAPDHADAWNNRGNALLQAGRIEESSGSFRRALALAPAFVDARVNLGHALLEQGRIPEAQSEFAAALAVQPLDASACNGLGMALQRAGDYEKAGDFFAKALEARPGYGEAIHNLALLHLFRRNFSRAWDGYESRLAIPDYRMRLRANPDSVARFDGARHWRGPGHDAPGGLAVWAEQGIGDQILFSTLLPELEATGQPVVCEIDRRLISAYRRSFPALTFVELSDPPLPALMSMPASVLAGSLPRWFRQDVQSFSRQPRRILGALPQRVDHYGGILGRGCRVALSWRTRRTDWRGRSKNLFLEQLAPLLRVPGVRWVDVQYGDTVDERNRAAQHLGVEILHFDDVDYYNDLDEVLAIIEASDLLITTSNVSAHLAAALGKPVWLLYPGERAPFHYWAHGGDHRCLWYPSVEIVSAPELTDWPELIAHAAEKLRTLVAGQV